MKILFKLVPLVIVVAVVAGLKFFNVRKDHNEIKKQVTSAMQAEMGEVLSKEYIAELVEYAHPYAMDQAYTMGGRRTQSKLNHVVYGDVLHQKIAEKLSADGKAREAFVLYGKQ